MDSAYLKKLFVDVLTLYDSYFLLVIIIWILMHFLMVFFRKIYINYNKKNIFAKLCESVTNNETVNCVRILEDHPEYVNKYAENGYTPFLLACASGNTQLLKIMLKKGADVKIKSFQFESPFYLACFYYIQNPKIKDATCIRELYYVGADINEPNYKGLTPLQMAATFGHTPLVKWLLCKNARTNVFPHPFLLALAQGHRETANLLWPMGSGIAVDCK